MATDHFQTCVYVCWKDSTETRHITDFVINYVKGWLCKKARSLKDTELEEELLSGECSRKLRDRCSFVSGQRTSLRAIGCFDRASNEYKLTSWACSFKHSSTVCNEQRWWTTNIGVRTISSSACLLTVNLSHELDKYSLTHGKKTPYPSVPNFLKWLITARECYVCLDTRFALPDKICYSLIASNDDWNAVQKILISPLRKYVVIVCNGSQTAAIADDLAKQVIGKVMVFLIEDNPEMREVMGSLDTSLRVPHNTIRIFYPQIPGGDVSSWSNKNRWFHLDDFQASRYRIVSNLLASYEIRNIHAVSSYEQVDNYIKILRFKELMQGHKEEDLTGESKEELAKQLQETRELLNATLENNEELDKDNKVYDRLLKEADRDYEALFKKNKALTATLEGVTQSKSSNLVNPADLAEIGFPNSLTSVLKYAALIYGDRLVFHEDAFKDASEYSDFTSYIDCFNMLKGLATEMYEMSILKTKPLNTRQFWDDTGYKVSLTDSHKTKTDPKFSSQREVVYKGRTVECFAHVKWGNRRPNCLRIHFFVDYDDKKILIGHVVDHLDNQNTEDM